jgi:hypothetical protein
MYIMVSMDVFANVATLDQLGKKSRWAANLYVEGGDALPNKLSQFLYE